MNNVVVQTIGDDRPHDEWCLCEPEAIVPEPKRGAHEIDCYDDSRIPELSTTGLQQTEAETRVFIEPDHRIQPRMGGVALDTYVRRLRPNRLTALSAIAVLQLEILLVLGYVIIRDVRITEPLILVYPFLWINVSLWALLTTTTDSSSRRYRYLATAVGIGYFLILAYFGGLLGFGTGARMIPLHIDWTLPPGYSPVLLYQDSLLRLVIEPYKLVGYLTLAYLVYTTVLDTAGSTVSGVVGLFSCVSCSWPILATAATSLFGSSSAVASFALDQTYGLSTLAFFSAIALLYWRPLR